MNDVIINYLNDIKKIFPTTPRKLMETNIQSTEFQNNLLKTIFIKGYNGDYNTLETLIDNLRYTIKATGEDKKEIKKWENLKIISKEIYDKSRMIHSEFETLGIGPFGIFKDSDETIWVSKNIVNKIIKKNPITQMNVTDSSENLIDNAFNLFCMRKKFYENSNEKLGENVQSLEDAIFDKFNVIDSNTKSILTSIISLSTTNINIEDLIESGSFKKSYKDKINKMSNNPKSTVSQNMESKLKKIMEKIYKKEGKSFDIATENAVGEIFKGNSISYNYLPNLFEKFSLASVAEAKKKGMEKIDYEGIRKQSTFYTTLTHTLETLNIIDIDERDKLESLLFNN